MRFSFFSLFSLVLLLLAPSALAAPRLEARVGTERAYLGDSFIVQVSLLDAPDADVAAPRFPNAAPADIAGGAPNRSSSSRVTIVNGKRTTESKHSLSWTYQVTPRNAGAFALGSVSVEVAGRNLTAAIPPVTIIGAEPQPYISVAVSARSHEVLPEEEFTVAVEIIARQFQKQEPFPGGNFQPPLIEIPFLADGAVENAAPTLSVDEIVSPLLQRRDENSRAGAGFRINNFTINDSPGGIFGFSSMFSEQRPAIFYPTRTETTDAEGNPAFKYRFEFPFKAVSEGTANFASVRFKGAVMLDGEPISAQNIFAVSAPLKIRVVPPPSEGRPASFVGSLATRLEAVATLDAQTCREGDPLLLTLEIRGDPTLANMHVPDIALAKGFTDLFRQYGDVESSNLPNGGRAFKYKIRPIASGTIEFPPIPISYFDKHERAYKTVFTTPVPLRVNHAPEFVFDDATDGAAMFLPARRRNVSGLVSNGFLTNESNEPRSFYSLLAKISYPPIVFVTIVALSGLWRSRSRIAGALRRRSVPARALRRLERAKNPAAVFAALSLWSAAAFRRFKNGAKPSRSITPDEIKARLAERGDIAPERIAEIDKLLREVFNASFDPSADPVKVVKERRSRIAELFAGIKFVLIFAALAQTSFVNADDFTMRQALATASAASAPEDFIAAARLFRPLVEAQPADTDLLYNYGTLLLLADENALALDAFQRAEALVGYVPELSNNLAIARGDSSPWLHAPLFWHYGLPLRARENILFAAWCALWLGLLARRYKLRRIGVALSILGLVWTILLASSVIASKRVLDRPLPQIEQKGDAQ